MIQYKAIEQQCDGHNETQVTPLLDQATSTYHKQKQSRHLSKLRTYIEETFAEFNN